MPDSYISKWQSGLPETPCGAGSKIENTEKIRSYLPNIIHDYKIKSIADVGCGDKNWIKLIDFPQDIAYSCFDVVPTSDDVIKFDAVTEILPEPVDLIICIFVLNHLVKSQDSVRALHNFKMSGSKYLLMTNYKGEEVPGYWLGGRSLLVTSRHHWSYNLWRLNT